VDEEHPTQPDDIYGKTKLIGELLCECYSRVMRTVVIRFSSVFGRGDNSRVAHHFMKSAVAGQTILVDGDGSQSSDFIYVDDAMRGAMLALERGDSGEIYNIGSGQETSVLELANLIAGLGNKRSEMVEVKLSGQPATRPFRIVADIEKARKELGYCPGDLVDGMGKYREEMSR
jgi:UDP-glucose 4-epimerase